VQARARGKTATVGENDGADRVTAIRHRESDNTTIEQFTYTRDDAGNPRTATFENGDVVTWTYDDVYRLSREQRDGADSYDITYTYPCKCQPRFRRKRRSRMGVGVGMWPSSHLRSFDSGPIPHPKLGIGQKQTRRQPQPTAFSRSRSRRNPSYRAWASFAGSC
jgi:hypothetical protein